MAASTNDPMETAFAASWPDVSSRTCTIAGITTKIFGLDELPQGCTEVACLWLLHPRLKTQSCMLPIAALAINAWNTRHKDKGNTLKGLIAVSFDQRNHGSREVDSRANQSWREGNETHAQDMYSIYRGTAIDTSLILDHLASYAFPGLPVRVSQNVVLGISLGGHAVWHVLLHDSRFDSGVVVIGCPDYLSLMSDRARLSKLDSYTTSDPQGSSFAGGKHFPADLVAAVKAYDPAGLTLNRIPPGISIETTSREGKQASIAIQGLLQGKHILNMSGGSDKLVPYRCGERFISWFQKAIQDPPRGQELVIFHDKIFDGVGHEFTPPMLEEAVAFIVDRVGSAAMGASKAPQSKI